MDFVDIVPRGTISNLINVTPLTIDTGMHVNNVWLALIRFCKKGHCGGI